MLQTHIWGMLLAKDLPGDLPRSWPPAGSRLLLNPRMDPAWRDRVLSAEFPDAPGNIWLASSGTGGRLKLVALSTAAFEASARSVNAHLSAGPNDAWINPLPLFHVGGLGIVVRAALAGCAWVEFVDWDPVVFVRRASDAGATLSSLVPAQVHDLVRSGCSAPASLRAVVVGGGALDEGLRVAAQRLGWPLLPSYGLTEACSQVATAALGAADCTWLPLLPHMQARIGDRGALELSGPSLLTGWMLFDADGRPSWEDPKADGWLRTADRAEIRGRELRALGRLDDLVKIRGELVDIAALERALQSRVQSGTVCLRVRDDARNGFALDVVADNPSAADEARAALGMFPPYARPGSVEVGAIARTALGKIAREPRA